MILSMDKETVASRIYAHRGFWNSKSERNTLKAFESASYNGFSVETDFREHKGRVVISHDLVEENQHPMQLDDYLNLGIKTAVNIKSDGLSGIFDKSRDLIEATESWVFDGSIPEMLIYKKLGIKHALRISEVEQELPWAAPVLWFDCFFSDWYVNRIDLIEKFSNCEIVLVSPEIHSIDFRRAWDYFKNLISIGFLNVSLCTDYPDKIIGEINNEV